MRILYYNWVDYLDDEARGGGVSVYQRNVMRAWDKERGVQATFLCAGLSFDLKGNVPRWEKLRHGPDENRANRYEIVNSAVLASGHSSYGDPAQISDAATEDVVADFILETGPYDVVHFNNLEGLPVDVLRLKLQFPKTKFILSLHNYYPICPQVNLWQREEVSCADFESGRACVNCLPVVQNPRHLRLANALAYRLKSAGIRPGSRLFSFGFRNMMRVGSRASRLLAKLRPKTSRVAPDQAPHFAARRPAMIDAINANCDVVLAVSDRVGQIAADYGIRPDILHTSYIGTAHAAYFEATKPAQSLLAKDGTVRVAYLGYMRADKGFPFLLSALENLDDADAARLHLVVAARQGSPDLMHRMMALEPRLASLTHLDGYTADGLDDLLEGVDLGLIPVMWEDNLPQVAIEMHARHIPLLTSDMGGASELGGGTALVHRAGDVGDFDARIADVLQDRVDLDAYWADALAPVSMDGHIADLKRYYQS
ncbi:glycosyltransferase [Sulfitobacter sp. SK012]|uniref:glycosyltransferase n=1 Tax=Sulfitobacter sp. SK012 TaxID=1389005 RepID=UPI000E0A9D89|nr:glycosyltransferase [Sulfitobacter sp. SK012]AXI48013.1 glycosyltransferase [Sulfitobacter sp. SK012]